MGLSRAGADYFMDTPRTFDASRSLVQLEEEDWSFDPECFDAPRQAYSLVTKPVRRLTAAELMHLVRWRVSLRFTIPAAIDRMMGDPFLKAGTHEGDLLVTLLEADSSFWRANHALWCEMVELLARAIGEVAARAEAAEGGDYLPQFLGDDFMAAVMHFRDLHAA